tara:strand:- start:3856 stop:4560 length:705 start_codon:yes stop_codon:yes gene_type:complete
MRRIIVYLALLLIFIGVVQWKKIDVIKQRTKDVVSIPGEIKKYGWPVDVEQIKERELYKSMRVTVLPDSLHNKKVSFYVSRKEITQVRSGQIVVNSINGEKIGKVGLVRKTPDLSTGLYKADVYLNRARRKTDERISAIDVIIDSIKNAISVPVESVDSSYKKNKFYIWLAKNGIAKPVEVTLGVQGQGRVEISSSLAVGDKVVINGYKALEEGYNLRIRECKNCKEEDTGAAL